MNTRNAVSLKPNPFGGVSACIPIWRSTRSTSPYISSSSLAQTGLSVRSAKVFAGVRCSWRRNSL